MESTIESKAAPGSFRDLSTLGRNTRIFVSMPYVEALTPRILADRERAADHDTDESTTRREGIFAPDEIAFSPFDRGCLFGDGVYEDISFAHGQIFVLSEHLANLYDGTRKVSIPIPYSKEELAWRIAHTVRATEPSDGDHGRIRVTVTRGLGDLDLHPRRSLAATVSIMACRLAKGEIPTLEEPIELSLSRKVRRQRGDVVDPNLRSCSSLNSILGVLESSIKGKRETIMVNTQGIVAEATSGHLFFVFRGDGWETNRARATLITPSPEHCLASVARDLTMLETRRLGFCVREADDMHAIDFAGPDRECFTISSEFRLTPVTAIENRAVGDGRTGPVTEKISAAIALDKRDPAFGLTLAADEAVVSRYLEEPTVYER